LKLIKGECSACNGTGIYHGFAEEKGVAVVCYKCHGKGYIEIKPFTKRKTLHGIKHIKTRGEFIDYSK